jgi:hypothetical protein
MTMERDPILSVPPRVRRVIPHHSILARISSGSEARQGRGFRLVIYLEAVAEVAKYIRARTPGEARTRSVFTTHSRHRAY